jgi:hypothetical protein
MKKKKKAESKTIRLCLDPRPDRDMRVIEVEVNDGGISFVGEGPWRLSHVEMAMLSLHPDVLPQLKLVRPRIEQVIMGVLLSKLRRRTKLAADVIRQLDQWKPGLGQKLSRLLRGE